MIGPDSIQNLLSLLDSEPSLTITFGFALVCTATFVRQLNRYSRKDVEEQMPVGLKRADERLGNVSEVEFELSAPAMMSSSHQMQSELRQ
jgi:hypothetical protein